MSNENRCGNTIVTLSLAGLLSLAGAVGCEKSQPVEEVKKEAPPAAATSEPMSEPMMEEKAETPAAGTATALMAPEASAGRAANDEGVSHAQQAHWDVAEGHFRKAIEADPKLAEAQYNLGLALDKLGKHDAATAAFKKAAELAPANTEITESPILKKHIGA